MTITTDQIFLLNNKSGSIARKVQLGTLIKNAEDVNAAEMSHYVYAAGEFTTAGGDTDETITVADLLATDIVIVALHTAGSTPVTVIDAAAAAGQINVDMSADPSTDHVLSYVCYRAPAS